MASPIVRYEKSEIVVMRRGDVVDRQESERVTDGKGSTISGSDAGAAAPNKGVSTAQVQLLPHGEDAAEPRAGGRAQGGPDKVHVPRLLDPLKLGAIASTAFGAFVCATKRDASRARAFWPRSPLLPAAADDDGSYYYPAPRLDPHLVALNALLGAAYMSLGAAQGVMSLTSDRAPRRLFHLWNVAQTLLNQLTANVMLGIFGAIGAWSLSLFFRGGKKKKQPSPQQQKKGQQQFSSNEQDSDILLG